MKQKNVKLIVENASTELEASLLTSNSHIKIKRKKRKSSQNEETVDKDITTSSIDSPMPVSNKKKRVKTTPEPVTQDMSLESTECVTLKRKSSKKKSSKGTIDKSVSNSEEQQPPVKKAKGQKKSIDEEPDTSITSIDNNRKDNKKPLVQDKEEKINAYKTSIIVENLPVKIILNYKNILKRHFQRHGSIKRIGKAEFHTAEAKPVFTTTLQFVNETSVAESMDEDNTIVASSRVRVRPMLPKTESTLVVWMYGDLTEQALSSAFVNAGKVRSIRVLDKKMKKICTAFIEFDGSEAVEKALEVAKDVRINSRKIHRAAKFEVHKPGSKTNHRKSYFKKTNMSKKKND